MGAWALQNYGGGWSSNPAGGSVTVSLPVIDTAGGPITGLRWWRGATTGTKPQALLVYDATTSSSVYSTSGGEPVPDSGAVGWQVLTLATPISLVTGREYRVAMYATLGDAIATQTTGVPTAASGLNWTAVWRRYNLGSGPTYPTTGDSAVVHGIDAYFDAAGAPPPAPEVTVTDVQNALASWLSTTDGTHSDSAPLQDHVALVANDIDAAGTLKATIDTAKTTIDATKGVVDLVKSAQDGDSPKIADIWHVAGLMTDAEFALWHLFFGRANTQITGASGGGGSAFYTSDDRLVSQLTAETHDRLDSLRNLTPVGGAGWTMSSSADFEDAIAFAEPADAYVLTITSYQPTQPATESPAGLWLPRLGWWCVLTGALASQRQFVDFEQMLLDAGGRRMPGCAIQLRPGTVATVQAWLLA